MANLYYNGKLTFSDILPGLSDAADALNNANQDVEGFLDDRKKSVEGIQKRVASIESELQRATQVAQEAQQALNTAQNILDEAKGILTSVADALDAAGIYHYYYVGRVGSFASTAATEFNTGLPDKSIADEAIVATILIAGGDGGLTAATGRIGSMIGQIGGNAQNVVDLYEDEINNGPGVLP